MKNRNRISTHYFFTMLLSLFAFAFASCSDDEVTYTSLGVSGDSYTFDGETPETYKIAVNSPMEWSYKIEGDWVKEITKDATSLTIGANVNDTAGERPGKITFTAGTQTQTVTLCQLAPGADKNKAGYHVINDFLPVIMSPRGTYAGGLVSVMAEDESTQQFPVLIETATGKRIMLEPIIGEEHTISAISDEGTMFFTVGWSHCIGIKIDGTVFDVAVPNDYSGYSVEAISADGKVMVGYAMGGPNGGYHGLKWTDPEVIPEILESPELNGIGEPLSVGVMARGCSADGSIIYGTDWDVLVPVYWSADGKVHYAGEDVKKSVTGVIDSPWTGKEEMVEVFSSATLEACPRSMSPNGRYMAVNYMEQTIENKQVVARNFPLLIDLQTSVSVVVRECEDAAGLTVMNDGTLMIGTPSRGVAKGKVYNSSSKTVVDSSEWIKQRFNLIVAEDVPIIHVSEDEGVMLCWRPRISPVSTAYLFSYITAAQQ